MSHEGVFMPNLVAKCSNRKAVKEFVQNFMNNHEQYRAFPSAKNDSKSQTYKMYSKRDVKYLYILKNFIKKRLVKSDYELEYLLMDNCYYCDYLKLFRIFTAVYNESFVKSLSSSVYETARKIQFVRLSLSKQKKLIEVDDFFKNYTLEVVSKK